MTNKMETEKAYRFEESSEDDGEVGRAKVGENAKVAGGEVGDEREAELNWR